MILSLSKEKGIEQFEGFTCPVNNGLFHSKQKPLIMNNCNYCVLKFDMRFCMNYVFLQNVQHQQIVPMEA